MQRLLLTRRNPAVRPQEMLETARAPGREPRRADPRGALDPAGGHDGAAEKPAPPGSLAFAAWVCVRLGGWTGCYGKPGPITILNGWLDFQSIRRDTQLMAQQDV